MNLVDVCGTASSAGPEEVVTDTEVFCTRKELICDNRFLVYNEQLRKQHHTTEQFSTIDEFPTT